MDVFQAIGTQRAMRRLKPDPVSDEHLWKVLDAAIKAPSGGNRQPWMAPHGCYPCRGEDRWLTIAVRNDADWRALCGGAQPARVGRRPTVRHATGAMAQPG